MVFGKAIGEASECSTSRSSPRLERASRQRHPARHGGSHHGALFTGNYKEQVTWRDAATGQIISESDYFEPLTPGSLVTPGFGGRVYFPTAKGFIVMQVIPKSSPPSSN